MTRGRAELTKKAVASALMQIPPPVLLWVVEDGLVGDSFAWDKGGPVRITRWEEKPKSLAQDADEASRLKEKFGSKSMETRQFFETLQN